MKKDNNGIVNINIKDLMNENEMLSHIFLGCIPSDKLKFIRDKYIGKKDWKKESLTLPVEMKIAGVNVNPKQFFITWEDQMNRMIIEKANEIVEDKLASSKMVDMMNKLSEYEQILNSWEKDINWEVKNPLKD